MSRTAIEAEENTKAPNTRRRMRRGLLATAAAAILVVGPTAVQPASAFTEYWSPVSLHCGSKYAQVTYTVNSGGWVKVGYTNSPQGNYWNGNYWQFNSAGTYTRNPGYHDLTWQKWTSAGDITKWSYTCVNFT